MANALTISIAKLDEPKKGVAVFLVAKDGKLPPMAGAMDTSGQLKRAMTVSEFKGATNSVVDVVAPEGMLDRILIVGTGSTEDHSESHWMKVGGKIAALTKKAALVTVLDQGEKDGDTLGAEAVAAIAAGAKLRCYEFDKYKTKKGDDEKPKSRKIVLATTDATAIRKAWKQAEAIADGVIVARDLVNEPANTLGPVEFAAEAKKLEKLGVEVEILTEKELKKLKMGALLGVAQGSVKPARVAVMKWNGGKAKDQPLAFIGKGVVFDTGGISIKPAGGMEDMKGDMGGAAAVTGLMHALAARKAKANVIGIIGLVENMPDGNAQRPGDIVTSMSGQTIEVLNTDAEGRLVLADALWYCQDKYKPKFMINLATLTGAILIALGNEHAGLFSNDDELSENLLKAGIDTDEKLWRLPLNKAYDKLIDSKNADMKNIGGRLAGSITAGQFLQRFVNDTPWAHLDIAGTAMNSPKNEYSQSWASGFGVRLLDRLVANAYE